MLTLQTFLLSMNRVSRVTVVRIQAKLGSGSNKILRMFTQADVI